MKVYMVLMVCMSALTLASCGDKESQENEQGAVIWDPSSQKEDVIIEEELDASTIGGGQWQPDASWNLID